MLDLLSGLVAVLSNGEAVAELGVGKLMQAPRTADTKVTPDVLAAVEVQLKQATTTRLETLEGKNGERVDPLWSKFFVR